ncbi:FIST signal transduction protein [Anatilimnocola aggregata]|nr:FIST N-terminal domain-containing protein [Anatilimnocola aggregata]
MAPSASSPHRFASALSTDPDPLAAALQVCRLAKEQLRATPDLAVLFVSAQHAPQADALAMLVCEALGTENVIGCTAEGIVGVGREVEFEPAVSLWLASWPGVFTTQLRLNYERTRDGGAIQGWPAELEGEWPADAFLLLLAEPLTFQADLLLERLNEDRPGVPIHGGMASGGYNPGENRLFCGREALVEGAVGVFVHGDIKLRSIVSQGCRPIGKPFVVTKAERNVIHELGGKPALLQLKELFDTLPTREQVLVQRNLHVGRVVSEYQATFGQGDFLVRNVMGIDPNDGAIALGDYIRTGQTVQFHVRDQEAADAELKQMLNVVKKSGGPQPLAGLLFACNGRGSRMFSQSDHDAGLIAKLLGDIPLAGLFAAGEFGPVGHQNFLHGHTASIALFEPRS